MKISVITPTHDPRHIVDAYESLSDQTYPDWEWILVLNGDARDDDIPDSIRDDPRVFVSRDDENKGIIGSIKHDAFMKGTGEVLVEFDHDDMLVPECLEKLHFVFSNREDVGFVYSDDAHLQDGFVPFNSRVGWKYYNYNWRGKDLTSMISFPPCAQTLSSIYYAPDHVRAWRTSVYREIDGHDKTLEILDDQELLTRTYLKTTFFKIPETLYIYRVDGKNSWLKFANDTIPHKTQEIFQKYAQQLAERDSELRGLRNIQLVYNKWNDIGYETMGKGGSIAWDFDNKKFPLEDDSVGVFFSYHTLQKHPDKIHMMREIYRVCADFSWAFLEVPSTKGPGAFSDPSHVSFWNNNSWLYYTSEHSGSFAGTEDIKFQAWLRDEKVPPEQGGDIWCTKAWMTCVKSKNYRCGELNYDNMR
jgi:glycosyltransferase involved in cell wall biosynthesis